MKDDKADAFSTVGLTGSTLLHTTNLDTFRKRLLGDWESPFTVESSLEAARQNLQNTYLRNADRLSTAEIEALQESIRQLDKAINLRKMDSLLEIDQ